MDYKYPVLLWVGVLGSLIGSVQFGFHIGILNTCLHQLAYRFEYYNVMGIQTSAIVVSLLVGAAIGSLPAGMFADFIGPKRLMLYNTVVFVAGGLLSTFAIPGSDGMIMFSVGRFLTGLGAGVVGVCSPRYIAEVAPMSIRGALGSLHQVFINVGIVISYLLGLPYEMWTEVPKDWWQIMLLVGTVIPLVQAVVLLCIPESFRWLRMNGDLGAAQVSGERMWGRYWDQFQMVAEPLLEWEDEKRMNQEPFVRIFARRYAKVMLLGCAVVLFQQLSGINTVILYSRSIFIQVGLQSAILGSVFVGVTNVTFTVVSGLLMDRTGRKALLLFSHGGMAICLGVISFLQWGGYGSLIGRDMEPLVLFFLVVLYVICFALGAGPIPWVYVAEIMPERIKGYGAAIATSLNWVGVIVVGFTFPPMLEALGTGPSYAIYGVLNFFCVVFFSIFMLETKQMPFTEIENQLLLPDRRGGEKPHENYHPSVTIQESSFQYGSSSQVRYYRVPSNAEIKFESMEQGPMRYNPQLTAKSGILKTSSKAVEGQQQQQRSKIKKIRVKVDNEEYHISQKRQVHFPDEIQVLDMVESFV